VICTDFILWKEVVEENECGICVNPNNVNEITDAINYLINNPDIAIKMGENGRRMVQKKYSWEFEEKKLLEIYRSLKY
jgi:glycosyltransferase involved in cell wall biosynthesis